MMMMMMMMMVMMMMIAIFVYNNIHNNNYYCNYHIADHDDDDAAAAAAAAADYDDDNGSVYGDNAQFQMLSIIMLTMILMSNIITTAITHLPALRCLTRAAAGMDGPPYTCLLLWVAQKLQNSWSTPNRTSPRGTGAANVPAVRACAAVLSTSRAALQSRQNSPQIGHRLQQIRRGCLPAQRRRA